MPTKVVRKRRQARKPKQNVANIAKAVVKRELAKNLEDKFAIKHLDPSGDFVDDVPDQALSNAVFFEPTPIISQGPGIQQRIGNELIPKSHNITGYCYLNQAPDNEAFAKSQITKVKVFVALIRATNAQNTVPNPLPAGMLLRDEGGLTTDFLGYSGSGQVPVNYDTLKMNQYFFKPIKVLTFTLGKNSGVLNGNNDPISGAYKMSHRFNINLSKHLPKKFIYNLEDSKVPQNYYPVLYTVAWNACNGSLVAKPQMTLKSVFKYTDA